MMKMEVGWIVLPTTTMTCTSKKIYGDDESISNTICLVTRAQVGCPFKLWTTIISGCCSALRYIAVLSREEESAWRKWGPSLRCLATCITSSAKGGEQHR